MFSVSKCITPPESLSQSKYDGDDVHSQLKKDFFDKCYICGGKVANREVEHFIPHSVDETKKYDWNNLFLACGYCNNRKSTTYNNKGKDILDSTKDDIETMIFHNISMFAGSEPVLIGDKKNKKVKNTIELLEKIYTEKGASNVRQNLENRQVCDAIVEEVNKFRKDYEEFYKIKNCPTDTDYDFYLKRVARHFRKSTVFLEFKIGIVNQNKNIKIEIEKILKSYKSDDNYYNFN